MVIDMTHFLVLTLRRSPGGSTPMVIVRMCMVIVRICMVIVRMCMVIVRMLDMYACLTFRRIT